MARWQGTTTQRGLGAAHQSDRRAALTALKDGDPCYRCELRGIYHPMYASLVTWRNGKPTSQWLDLDDYPGRIYGGPQVKRLSWRKCNRSHGQSVAAARLRARGYRPRARTYTRW